MLHHRNKKASEWMPDHQLFCSYGTIYLHPTPESERCSTQVVELILFVSYAAARRCYALCFGIAKALAEQSAAFALMSKLLDANVLDYHGLRP